MTQSPEPLVGMMRPAEDDYDIAPSDWQVELSEAYRHQGESELAPQLTTSPPGSRPDVAMFDVGWQINIARDEAQTPAAAAHLVWTEVFDAAPERPGPQIPCVFDVTDRRTGDTISIDLSDEQHASLFEQR